MHDIKTLLNNLTCSYNKHGKNKKLITISDSSIKKLKKAHETYNISEGYIIDVLIQKYL